MKNITYELQHHIVDTEGNERDIARELWYGSSCGKQSINVFLRNLLDAANNIEQSHAAECLIFFEIGVKVGELLSEDLGEDITPEDGNSILFQGLADIYNQYKDSVTDSGARVLATALSKTFQDLAHI